MLRRISRLLPFVLLASAASGSVIAQDTLSLKSTTVMSGRDLIWDMAFLPNGTIFFTEKVSRFIGAAFLGNKRAFLTFVAVVSTLCPGRIALAADWLIVPGVRVGSITRNTSESDLKKIYGEAEVVAADIDIGEGQTEAGTILFPRQKAKALTLFWTDEARTHVAQVQIHNGGTKWRTDKGVTIGTPLKAIEKLNGRPVHLAGFGWDYSGTILDCDGGALKELGVQTPTGILGRTLLIRVAPQAKRQGSAEYRMVLGDRTFKSDHVAMRKLNPAVYTMIVDLR